MDIAIKSIIILLLLLFYYYYYYCILRKRITANGYSY